MGFEKSFPLADASLIAAGLLLSGGGEAQPTTTPSQAGPATGYKWSYLVAYFNGYIKI